MASTVFNYTGSLQYFTVPNNVYTLSIKVWGAGGGGSVSAYNSVAGAGGYSFGKVNVTPGQVLEIMVGQGGKYSSNVGTYGAGGAGGNAGSGWYGSSGGGRSGVAFSGQNQFIIAGGGAGSGIGVASGLLTAGNGGGLSGNNEYIAPSSEGYANLTPAQGGTQTAGGAGGISAGHPTTTGSTGSSLQGGKGGLEGNSGGGGGGGGGYWGGGGGVGATDPYNEEGGGGGGSGYLDNSILFNSQTTAATQTTTKQPALPPNTADPAYIAGIGVGPSTAVSGGNGLVVFDYTPVTFTKSANKTYTTISDTLTYTITIQNPSSQTLNNVQFLDTIPSATSLVANSLTINGTATTSNPTPPGVNVGPLNANSTTTLTFQVVVNSTFPNPIVNIAQVSLPANTIPGNSNTVSTTISAAFLSSSKVAKAYANIGDVLTYTIPIKNIGNTTAFSVKFIDTLPAGTTLVANSFKQDATPISGSPNPPGVTLPNVIGIGATSTVTFQVTVTTLPTPNPIPNSATQIFSYTINSTTTPNITGTSKTSTNTITTFVNIANLSSITKGVDKNYATLNDILTYTITIPNTGTTTASSVVFRDTIPNGTTLVANSLKVNGMIQSGASPNPPGISIGTIPAGGIFTVSFQVQITTIPSPNVVQNSCATSFTYQVDPTTTATTNGSAGSNLTTTTITRMAIISPTKSVDLPGAFVGDTLTYTISFKNTGTTLANTITFVDTTPNGTTFVPSSVILNGTTLLGATLTPPGITLPNLAVGQVATLTFQVVVATIPTPNPTTNQGTVNYSYSDVASGTSGSGTNNTNIVSTYIYPGNNPFKGVDTAYATVGHTLTYTLGFIAALGVQENNVTFFDTIPSGTTFVPNSVFIGGINQPGATITLPNGINTGTLSANSLVTVSFQVVVNTLPIINPIVNECMLTHTNTIAVGTQTKLSNTVTTQINLANLSNTSKSVDKAFTTLGDTLTYTVVVSNTGNTTAQSVIFLDSLPNATSFVPNSLVVNGVTLAGFTPNPPTGAPIGTIPIGGVTTILFQATVNTLPTPNTLPNSGNLIGDFVVNPMLGTTTSFNVTTNTVVSQVIYADLSHPTKQVNLDYADLGTTLTYTITLINSGNTTATNVTLLDTVPTYTSFISGSILVDGVTLTGISPNPLTIPVGTLPAGSTATITFQVLATTLPTSNPVSNFGLVSYTFIVNPSVPISASGTRLTNTVSTTINHAYLGPITKFVDRQYATCGSLITYTISIPNTGNVDALNVLFHDTIPNGTSYVPGSLSLDGTTIIGTPSSISIGTIPAGNTAIVTFQVQVLC